MRKENFKDCFIEVSAGSKKVKKSELLDEGVIPVIDQGKSTIAGYTNDSSKLFKGELPCIIFGDHSKHVKFIDFPFAIGADGVKVFNTTHLIDIEYGYYFLRSTRLPSIGYGRHYKYLKKVLVPVFNFEKQIEIKNRLNKIEDVIDKRKQTIDLLEEYQKSMFLKTFGDPIINIKDWPTKEIKDLPLFSGSTPKRGIASYFNGSINWAKSSDLKGGEIRFTEETISEIGLSKSSCKLFPINTILIAMYGDGKTRGEVGLLKIESTCNQACAAIQPNNFFSPVFLFSQLKYSYLYLRSLGKGGNRKNLSLTVLKKHSLIMPHIDLQKNYELQYNKILNIKSNLLRSSELIEELSKAFIYDTFSGREKNKLDEIDILILDDIKLELFLNTINASDFESEEQYNIAIEDLYKVLDRTKERNELDSQYLKGIIQRIREKEIVLETNKENKFRLSNEAI